MSRGELKRLYVHPSGSILSDPRGQPLRIWFVDGEYVLTAHRAKWDGPTVLVHEAGGVEDPEGLSLTGKQAADVRARLTAAGRADLAAVVSARPGQE